MHVMRVQTILRGLCVVPVHKTGIRGRFMYLGCSSLVKAVIVGRTTIAILPATRHNCSGVARAVPDAMVSSRKHCIRDMPAWA